MIYQQYTTAVKRGYRDRSDVVEQRQQARAFREWLQQLSIDDTIRADLVEQVLALEHGFEEIVARAANPDDGAGAHRPVA
jgi:hypothetical protein